MKVIRTHACSMLLTRCNREFPNSKTTIDNDFLSLNLNQARVLLCINKTARTRHLCIMAKTLLHKYVHCKHSSSLDSRPIKIRPGTYCRGDSAHALVYSPESGESPFSFSHLFSIFVNQLSSLLRCSRRLSY